MAVFSGMKTHVQLCGQQVPNWTQLQAALLALKPGRSHLGLVLSAALGPSCRSEGTGTWGRLCGAPFSGHRGGAMRGQGGAVTMGQRSPRVPCAPARTPPCHHSRAPCAFGGKQHPHTLTLPAQRLSADPSTWAASSGCQPSGTEVQHLGPPVG